MTEPKRLSFADESFKLRVAISSTCLQGTPHSGSQGDRAPPDKHVNISWRYSVRKGPSSHSFTAVPSYAPFLGMPIAASSHVLMLPPLLAS